MKRWLLTLCLGIAASAQATPSMRQLIEADWIARDQAFSAPSTAPVTTAEDAAGGCDGVKTGKYGFHTASREKDPWWQVDLGQSVRIGRIVVYNRTDSGTAARTQGLRILIADARGEAFTEIFRHEGAPFLGAVEKKPLAVDLSGREVNGRIVRLMVPGTCSFALDEVEVYPADAPEKNIALGRPADQKSVGQFSTRKAGTSPSFSLAHTKQVLRQAKQLAARIAPKADPAKLKPLSDELVKLSAHIEAMDSAAPIDQRKQAYLEARWLARRIAFANPLLDIDRLLFIQRHAAGGVFHMCDQYYGFNAQPGGGLFVLVDPFGQEPRLVNLLENSTVLRGRLKGETLAGGAFLSPDVSFDGRTIAFAWTQTKGKDLEWTPSSSYHLFRVDADGSNLVQLTDGAWNDFDPCFLPNGRLAFISERRGGYLRCGRHCPVYTLYGMDIDGGDITCLSFHETHEWHPSVNNDGMLVYTRWDYVDRDTNIAHHIWTCYPDGRDPRSFHGNYPVKRESRPWMEMDIRAIPDLPLYVATAASHHGHAFGSLVLIDPRGEDDNAQSQLVRLTPDVPFPEAEKTLPIPQCQQFATPWPLSEEDFLCAYDPQAKNHGIYWIDRHGNRELIYRDPAIPCLSPIPLRARPRPPLIPTQTSPAIAGASPAATVAITNVYDSDFAWPKDTRIAALRVIQVLPKTTPPPNQPRIGVADQTNARAVLGTVPVELDGSAYFTLPAGKEVYFQALDADGLAVQSMRSGTYAHPGERLTCQGCHEPKRRSPAPLRAVPMALQRPPSPIAPDADGSNPFNYVRLVQGALDRNCVECHREKKALDLAGVIEDPHGWTRSYTNLAGKYGFYYHVQNGSINKGVHGGSRTPAGQFGARASKLMEYLDERHYGVKLAPADRRRITLWLDCNSEFYGSYENTPAQSRGEVVKPTLD